MTMKFLGSILIIVGSGGVGMALTSYDRQQMHAMQDLHHCLQWMCWELQYKRLPLADLAREAKTHYDGVIAQVMGVFADELQQQCLPNPSVCMDAAIANVKKVPKRAAYHLHRLGASLGAFDLENQLRSLDAEQRLCGQELEQMRMGMQMRSRNYRTLSLCAGTALVIILL